VRTLALVNDEASQHSETCVIGRAGRLAPRPKKAFSIPLAGKASYGMRVWRAFRFWKIRKALLDLCFAAFVGSKGSDAQSPGPGFGNK
jgi:hypothetical protein